MKKLECHIEVIDTGEECPDYFICTDGFGEKDFCYDIYEYDEKTGRYLRGFIMSGYEIGYVEGGVGHQFPFIKAEEHRAWMSDILDIKKHHYTII